jgi:hypothetical protein
MFDERRPIGVGVAVGGAPIPAPPVVAAPPPMPVGGPPPWAPAHGRRAQLYRYYYYPAAGVYYSVGTGSYFYMSGGGWQIGVSLPSTMVIDPNAYVALELDTDRPYLYYDEHRAKYAGWDGNGHGHGHGHGHGPW